MVPGYSQYQGGSGDGFSSQSFNGLTNGSSFDVLYNGGTADGFSFDSFNGLPNGSSFTVIYQGGPADGFSFESYSGLPDGSPITVLYAGGAGDGFSTKKFNGLPDGSSLTILYGGGAGDGFGLNFLAFAPVPIELVYFRALLDNNKVLLKWATAMESNNDFFTVEKSKDGENFVIVNRLEGKGNSTVLSAYQTTDPNLYYGTNYYRLKQTDFDGKVTYSSWEMVIYLPKNVTVAFYPNPNRDRILNLSINSLQTGQTIELNIINNQGRLMGSYSISNEQSLELPHEWTSGVYYLQFVIGEEKVNRQLLLID